MTYGLNNIGLIPARISEINHRSECNPYNEDDMLPIFTAPMNSVINEHNYKLFLKHKINTVIPRGVSIKRRIELSTKTFVAMSLQEFESFIRKHNPELESTDKVWYICVDVAQGSMKWLIDLCAEAKNIYGGRLLLMTGNIANPETYIEYSKAGIDMCRVSIGTGNACTTTNSTGVGIGIATLLKEVSDKRWEIQQSINTCNVLSTQCPYKSVPLIIADGGFNSNDKIIKALVLGADYVMIGKSFAQCEEACGDIVVKYLPTEVPITYQTGEYMDEPYYETVYRIKDMPIKHRVYYGMSTQRAQKETGKKKLTTSEGKELCVPINSNLKDWSKKFIDNLCSAMSYTNCKNLVDLPNVKYRILYNAE